MVWTGTSDAILMVGPATIWIWNLVYNNFIKSTTGSWPNFLFINLLINLFIYLR